MPESTFQTVIRSPQFEYLQLSPLKGELGCWHIVRNDEVIGLVRVSIDGYPSVAFIDESGQHNLSLADMENIALFVRVKAKSEATNLNRKPSTTEKE